MMLRSMNTYGEREVRKRFLGGGRRVFGVGDWGILKF